MNSSEEEPTDDELADLMDDGASDTSESGDDEGVVEVIPPALDSDDPELEVDNISVLTTLNPTFFNRGNRC